MANALHATGPDETTICKVRHLLAAHQLAPRTFEAVTTLLKDRKLLLRAGTIVDEKIIGAPSSTKNATETRAPAMWQRRNGRQWPTGKNVHIGTDQRGVIHSVITTDAAVADITRLPQLPHRLAPTLSGDKAYYKAEDKLQWELSGGR